eukprot:4287554-Pleurochrysis_carterae.AAC.1
MSPDAAPAATMPSRRSQRTPVKDPKKQENQLRSRSWWRPSLQRSASRCSQLHAQRGLASRPPQL